VQGRGWVVVGDNADGDKPMKRGDLVRLRPPEDVPSEGPFLWKDPLTPHITHAMTGELHQGDVALVIRVLANEAEVVSNRGEIGWVWIESVEEVLR